MLIVIAIKQTQTNPQNWFLIMNKLCVSSLVKAMVIFLLIANVPQNKDQSSWFWFSFNIGVCKWRRMFPCVIPVSCHNNRARWAGWVPTSPISQMTKLTTPSGLSVNHQLCVNLERRLCVNRRDNAVSSSPSTHQAVSWKSFYFLVSEITAVKNALNPIYFWEWKLQHFSCSLGWRRPGIILGCLMWPLSVLTWPSLYPAYSPP